MCSGICPSLFAVDAINRRVVDACSSIDLVTASYFANNISLCLPTWGGLRSFRVLAAVLSMYSLYVSLCMKLFVLVQAWML